MKISRNRIIASAIILILLGVVAAYAIQNTQQIITGNYVQVKYTISPPLVVPANLTIGEVFTYNSTLFGDRRFAINITCGIGSPAWVIANVTDWNCYRAQYKIIQVKQNVSLQMKIQIGRPPVDIDQPYRVNITFYGTRVR